MNTVQNSASHQLDPWQDSSIDCLVRTLTTMSKVDLTCGPAEPALSVGGIAAAPVQVILRCSSML